jgi:hypothetical protein
MKKKIILSFPFSSIKKIKHIFKETGVTQWLLLAKDYRELRKLEVGFGPGFKRIDISRIQNEIADDIRQSYISWIDELNKLNGGDLEWWYSGVSSRNPEETDLFQFFCYLEILRKLKKRNIVPDLIVAESRGLIKTVEKWAVENDLDVKITNCLGAYLKRTKEYACFFKQWIKYILVNMFRFLAAYVTKKIYKAERWESGPSIIINTYVFDNSISKEGHFRDRCFPYLHEYLSEKGFNVIVYPLLYGFRFNFFSIYKRMRKSKTPFLLPEDYLVFSDYFHAIMFPFRFFRRKIAAVPLRGFDMGLIIKEEQRLRFTSSSLCATLAYRFFLRLKGKMPMPKEIILWYENQLIHKAIIKGAREAFTKTKIIGTQMFIHPPNILNPFPTQTEFQNSFTPDVVLTTSDYQCGIARTFTKAVQCRAGAALRYAHLFNDYDNRKEGVSSAPVLLVLLSLYLDEAVEMLENVERVLNQIDEGIKIVIKCHPTYSAQELKEAFGKNQIPARLKIYKNGNISDALGEATVVIGSNSSSMVEAAARGLPVIFVGRQTVLSNNILANLRMENVTECYSISELSEAIKKYFNLSFEEIKEFEVLGKNIRDKYFKPVNEDNLSVFIKEG